MQLGEVEPTTMPNAEQGAAGSLFPARENSILLNPHRILRLQPSYDKVSNFLSRRCGPCFRRMPSFERANSSRHGTIALGTSRDIGSAHISSRGNECLGISLNNTSFYQIIVRGQRGISQEF
jgi:hypothetical protein